MLKAVVVEGHYENDQTPDQFRDLSHDDFYPLKVSAERLYLNTLVDYDSSKNLRLINSVYLGID